MNQPTPEVSHSDVERIVRRDFPQHATEVIALLEGYGTEDYHREKDRVRLAVLKLAHGSQENLARQIESAKYDYRDVLLAAEYPGYAKIMFRLDKKPEEERRRVIAVDWKQYTEWLAR